MPSPLFNPYRAARATAKERKAKALAAAPTKTKAKLPSKALGKPSKNAKESPPCPYLWQHKYDELMVSATVNNWGGHPDIEVNSAMDRIRMSASPLGEPRFGGFLAVVRLVDDSSNMPSPPFLTILNNLGTKLSLEDEHPPSIMSDVYCIRKENVQPHLRHALASPPVATGATSFSIEIDSAAYKDLLSSARIVTGGYSNDNQLNHWFGLSDFPKGIYPVTLDVHPFSIQDPGIEFPNTMNTGYFIVTKAFPLPSVGAHCLPISLLLNPSAFTDGVVSLVNFLNQYCFTSSSWYDYLTASYALDCWICAVAKSADCWATDVTVRHHDG